MMRLKNILLPTDLSQRSKRSLRYALSLATEYSATVTVVHVANELNSWELYCEEFSFMIPGERAWPIDRVVAEASLELSNFLEPYKDTIRRLPAVSKRVAPEKGHSARIVWTVATGRLEPEYFSNTS